MMKPYICFLFALFISFASCEKKWMRYEAEAAHYTGASLLKNDEAGFSGSGYVNFEDVGRIIFTVHAAVDDAYPSVFHTLSSVESEADVFINGYKQAPIVFSSQSWTSSKSYLNLRQGLNTVVIYSKGTNMPFSLDYMEVYGTIELAPRGATLPFFELEAENAAHNGVVIGPGRDYTTLPSEASGRKAVQIKAGQYVEFTLTGSANGISVRFSIPDTADGQGNTASLSVTVNGATIANLTLTSHFSWAYGTYPFTKNPSEGMPHHFYDETRALLKTTYPSGTKIRLVANTQNIIYTIDLADFHTVPAPYSQPSGTDYVSVMDFGADPTGQKDSTSAINSAILFGESNKKTGVWIPSGTFLVTTRFTYAGLVVRGAGPWYTIVKATTNHGVGFHGNWPQKSQNQLYDFAMSGDTNVRDDASIDSGAGGALENAIIQNMWIEHTKCGMWLDGPFNALHATGLVIMNTYADGVNFHTGITNSVIEQSLIRNAGDDGLAMWSQGTPDTKNVFKFNTIQMPVLANGIAIYGGSDNSATDNYIADTICEGGGLQASNRFGSVQLGGTTTFTRNTLVRTGSPNRPNAAHNGAMWYWAGDYAMSGNVDVSDIDIFDSSYAGITFWGSQMENVNFDHITIDTAPYAVEVVGVSGTVVYKRNEILSVCLSVCTHASSFSFSPKTTFKFRPTFGLDLAAPKKEKT
jgi:hypothetical protein